MFVKRLELEGFKCYEKKTAFEFTKKIEGIIGDNGTGKTTIGDSIRWLLAGCDANGNDKNNSLLLNKKSKEMKITAIIENEGKELKVERSYDGKSAVLTINGKKQSSKALETHYKDKDFLLALLDMEYVISLPNQKGRDFFMKLLPPAEKEDVIKRMQKADKLPKEEITDIDDTLKAIRTKIAKFEAEEANLSGRITALKGSIKTPPMEQMFEKQAELDALEKKLVDITASIQKQTELQQKLNSKRLSFMALEEKKKALLEKYYELNAIIKSLQESKCPLCGQSVKDAKEKAAEKSKEMTVIVQEGKDKAAEIKKLDDEIQKLMSELETFKDANSTNLVSKVNDLKNQKQNVELFNNSRKMIISNNVAYTKDIEKFEAAVEDLIVKKTIAEEKIEALKEYKLYSTQIQVEKVQQYFDRVTINLFNINPDTKEIKETYEVLWDGKEDRLLSRSEKIKAGMEIANMICKVAGISIPMFVDNAESITKYNLPDNNQVLIAKVVPEKEVQVLKKEKKAA